jgi:polysaccharide pyruvyl transferase WcaK-like protein
VGLNISGLLSMGGYSRANMFGLRIDYLDLMRAVIERFLEEHQVYLILVPHVYGEGQNSESDALACEKLFAEFQPKYPQRITRVVGKYNQNQIKYIIGMCDFFIGARMHACIAALSQYIPAVGIAYSRKFIGVFETIGIQSLVADPRILDYDQLMAVIFEAFEDRGKYTQQLEAVMPEVRDKILTMSKFL